MIAFRIMDLRATLSRGLAPTFEMSPSRRSPPQNLESRLLYGFERQPVNIVLSNSLRRLSIRDALGFKSEQIFAGDRQWLDVCAVQSVAMDWTHHLTVAAIAERDGRFLLVEERVGGSTVFNQPAGHLDAGESLTQGCARETLEEAAWDFQPEALVGIYQYQPPNSSDMYLRCAFCGRLIQEYPERELDDTIIRAVWMTRDEIAALKKHQRRSPMVLQCVDDYLGGTRYPLSLISS